MLLADDSKLFPLDLLAAAVLKRSLSLSSAFVALVRLRNYSCAASLVRLQLDSCLRFFAAFLVEDPHEFAAAILRGISVRDLKDRHGRKMTDRYLVDALGAKYKWMPSVYEATSGFIHLSKRHILGAVHDVKDDRTFAMLISETDSAVPDALWLEMIDGFVAATEAQFDFLDGWVFTKENPQLVAELRGNAR